MTAAAAALASANAVWPIWVSAWQMHASCFLQAALLMMPCHCTSWFGWVAVMKGRAFETTLEHVWRPCDRAQCMTHCVNTLSNHCVLCCVLQGFWWSHFTWLFSTEASMLDYANAPDLKAQWFYRYGPLQVAARQQDPTWRHTCRCTCSSHFYLAAHAARYCASDLWWMTVVPQSTNWHPNC